MMKRVGCIVGVLLVLLVSQGKAEDLAKVGYVDMYRVFNEYIEAQKARQELNKEITARQKEFTKLENEITSLVEELNTQEALLSKEERRKRIKEINQKMLDLEKYKRDVNLDLARKEEARIRKLHTEISSAIKKVGEKEGYTLILEKNSILYDGGEGMDLTDEVIKILNKGK